MVTVLLILAALAFVGAVVLAMNTDSVLAPSLAMVTCVVLLIVAVVTAIGHEEDACRAKGGTIQGTGQFYPVTVVVMAGKTPIPITNMVEETACVIP